MKIEKTILEMFFPKDTFEYFEITKGQSNDNDILITLEEKNIPPLTTEDIKDKKITAKKFKNITITDFPMRGKRVLLTFRRRYWKVEGIKEYITRDIKLNFPGTQLDKEFAVFLKEKSRREPNVFDEYSKYV